MGFFDDAPDKPESNRNKKKKGKKGKGVDYILASRTVTEDIIKQFEQYQLAKTKLNLEDFSARRAIRFHLNLKVSLPHSRNKYKTLGDVSFVLTAVEKDLLLDSLCTSSIA